VAAILRPRDGLVLTFAKDAATWALANGLVFTLLLVKKAGPFTNPLAGQMASARTKHFTSMVDDQISAASVFFLYLWPSCVATLKRIPVTYDCPAPLYTPGPPRLGFQVRARGPQGEAKNKRWKQTR
jgi:hypothetical protein